MALTLIDAMHHQCILVPGKEEGVDNKESRRDSPVKIQGGG